MARVLIVDDDGDVRDTLIRLLRLAGHDPLAPQSSVDAVRAVKSGDYDIVITDVIMPDLDGIEIIRLVRTVKPGCPIIAISGGSPTMPVELGLGMAGKLGANVTLNKPFSKDDLYAAISALVPNIE